MRYHVSFTVLGLFYNYLLVWSAYVVVDPMLGVHGCMVNRVLSVHGCMVNRLIVGLLCRSERSKSKSCGEDRHS